MSKFAKRISCTTAKGLCAVCRYPKHACGGIDICFEAIVFDFRSPIVDRLCPLCQATMPRSEFAKHAGACLNQFNAAVIAWEEAGSPADGTGNPQPGASSAAELNTAPHSDNEGKEPRPTSSAVKASVSSKIALTGIRKIESSQKLRVPDSHHISRGSGTQWSRPQRFVPLKKTKEVQTDATGRKSVATQTARLEIFPGEKVGFIRWKEEKSAENLISFAEPWEEFLPNAHGQPILSSLKIAPEPPTGALAELLELFSDGAFPVAATGDDGKNITEKRECDGANGNDRAVVAEANREDDRGSAECINVRKATAVDIARARSNRRYITVKCVR